MTAFNIIALKFNELNEMFMGVYRHQFPVKLGSVTVTVNFQGLLKKIDWNWTHGVSDQLTLAPPVVSHFFRKIRAASPYLRRDVVFVTASSPGEPEVVRVGSEVAIASPKG